MSCSSDGKTASLAGQEMMMRGFLFALAALCAACSPLAGHKGGYNLEIRASDDVQFFVVTAPDGHIVGARASKGQSALMDDGAIHALLATSMPAAATTSGTETTSTGEIGRAHV